MDFKVIYLLTDFSEHARNASIYAIEAFGSEVKYLLVNSFVVRSTAATLINIEEIAREESLLHLIEEEKKLRKHFSKLELNIQTVTKSGSPVDVINKLNENNPADIVVVGSKGISKLDEILIGSVTTAIMRGVITPVLSIPIKAKFQKMDQIVLGSDLANSNKPNVRVAIKQLKNSFNARISVASVKMDSAELTAEENGLLKELENNPSLDEINILNGKNVSKDLMDYCENIDADLLVVVAKHTSFFKRFFHKSITKELVNHEVLPILLLEDN